MFTFVTISCFFTIYTNHVFFLNTFLIKKYILFKYSWFFGFVTIAYFAVKYNFVIIIYFDADKSLNRAFSLWKKIDFFRGSVDMFIKCWKKPNRN